MGRKGLLACLCMISLGCLAGCEKTPEDAVVREKGADRIREYEGESEKAAGGMLRETLFVPEHYTDRAVYEDGRLVIDTDAEVFCPDVDAVSTYGVLKRDGGQELIDFVTEVFFPDAVFYRTETYNTLTKQECREKLTELNKYRAEGNLDPYGFGTDETGSYFFNIEQKIAQYENMMQDAPEEKVLEPIRPSLGLETVTYDDDGNPQQEVMEDYFYGTAVTAEGTYDYQFSFSGPNNEFTIQKNQEDLAGQFEPVFWVAGEELRNGQEETADGRWTEADIKQFVKLSYEEAEQIASEKAKKLGMDLAVYGWDYELLCRNNYEIQKGSILDGGYIFYFTRVIDGVPLTHTSMQGGGLEDIESTLETWKYEMCNIVVGSGGICRVELQNPYEVGDVQVKNVKLLDFKQIMQIYKQMMEISNADLASDEKLRTYHITRIALGYGRIYDPTANNEAGILIPMWDFFGGFDLDLEEESHRNAGEGSTRSFLTINAVDGTVIDRELGY